MSASRRHDKSLNDNVDDEIEEGLEAFPVSVEGISENNNFLTRGEVPPQLGKDDTMLMVNKNLNEQVEKTINTSQVPGPRSQCLKTLPPGWSFNLTILQRLTLTRRVNYERVTMKVDFGDAKKASIDKVKTGQIS